MKKYTLFLAVFSLLIALSGFNVQLTNASNCAPGELYNTSTGQPCSTVSRPVECAPGDLFSSITGQSCGEVVPIPACNIFPNFKIGTKGEEVRTFQGQLNAQGANLKVDGSYGPKTDSVARIYCKPNPSSVVITGVSGPQSLKVNQEGTWTVSAYNKFGGSLSYQVSWGDEGYMTTSGLKAMMPEQQSATFTHSYSTAGIYKPTFTVTSENTIRCVKAPCPSNAGSAQTSLSVNVGNITPPVSKITVLSPNGGETWATGTTQTIKWQDNTSMPTTNSCGPGCIISPLPPKYYDITLESTESCSGNICTLGFPVYTVAKKVNGSSYKWETGQVLDWESGKPVPNGSYRIEVCQSGTSNCDSSNDYFKITTSVTSVNTPPKLNLYDVPINIKAGESVRFSWSATDRDGDDLSWSVNWGDSGPQPSGVCAVTGNTHNGSKKGWSFSMNHTYNDSGRYTATVYVNDCYGGYDSQSFDVEVGSTILNPNITVLSPGKGTYYSSESLQVSWSEYTGSFNYYYVMLGNKYAGVEINLFPDNKISKYSTSLSVSAKSVAGTIEEIVANSGGKAADQIQNGYYVVVRPALLNSFGDETLVDRAVGPIFTILEEATSF